MVTVVAVGALNDYDVVSIRAVYTIRMKTVGYN